MSTLQQSLRDDEIVISFLGLLQLMVKSPQSKRLIDWGIRFFDKHVSKIDPDSIVFPFASRMVEELAICKHRHRSRVYYYNMSDIDQVYNQYYIHQSPANLDRAWDLFVTGKYRVDGI